MSQQVTREQITAAAEWWAARLQNCRNSGLSAEERADPSNRQYQFAEVLMQAGRPIVADAQVSAFRDALARRLEQASPGEQRTIGVDYGCDPVLGDALTEAGIPNRTGTLPIKTMMWLRDDGTVAVRYGYGAEVQVIYQPTVQP